MGLRGSCLEINEDDIKNRKNAFTKPKTVEGKPKNKQINKLSLT